MSVRIALRRRDGSVAAHTIVDDVDTPILAEHTWHLQKDGYAATAVRDPESRRFRTVLMHRLLLGLEIGDPRCSDHVNRDRLDNRRANLRVVTRAQNGQNVSTRRPERRGVGWDKTQGQWRARVVVGKREWFLGYFDDEAEAALVAADFRREHLPLAEGVAP